MSNTVITNFRDASGPRSSADSPFVVVLERDGTISLDNAALDGLVGGDGSQSTGISVVRVGQDGRPEDATDSENEDDSVPHVTLSVDGYYDDPNGIAKYDSGIEMLQSLSNETREHSLIGFQNDHCYTPLTSPDQTLQTHSASEISYNELQSKPTLPSSKKITILEQQIIPKGKKIVFNQSKAPLILKGKDVLNKPLPSLATKLNQKPISDKQEELSNIQSDKTESSSSSTSGESVNDRDSDADYKYARDPLNAKTRKSKTVLKGVKKVIAKNYGNLKHIKPTSKSKPSKSLIRQEIKDKIMYKKSKQQLEKKTNVPSGNKKLPEATIAANIATSKEPPKVEPKVETPKPQKVAKKDKKTPAHMTALLSDMTTLFSTPDVIRRVSTDGKQKGVASCKDATPANPQEPMEVEGSADSKDKVGKPSTSVKTYGKLKERVNLTEKIVKEIDVIPQLDDASLAQILLDTPAMASGAETTSGLGVNSAANPLSSPNLGPLSPTLDLLAGLQPEEEGLTEDLLMHVAQLVESSENLQEVIDKQVLGKVDAVPTLHTAQTYAQASAAAKSQRSNILRKDPIQIVRSDGRVITLPPIEAPATRSSKRKSLGATVQEQELPIIETHTTSGPEPTLVQANPKQYANKKLSVKKMEMPQPATAVTKLLPESDDSLNSEDDPYRLWCICKQPHNNRFMICCDRCEDWFHGKCVNITKAMGQQMEEQGVEWTCPNCIKKFQPTRTTPKPASARRSMEVVRGSSSGGTKAPEAACIVCEKAARAGSIYCGDSCILKHAQESLTTDTSSSDDTSHSRVIVFERKTGKVLQGANAPTADKLKSWLQEHPTFEVVRRERENKPMVNVRKPPPPAPARPPQNIQTTLKFDKQQKQIILLQPQPKTPQNKGVPSTPQDDPKPSMTPKVNASRPQHLKQTLLIPKEGSTTPKQGPPTPRQGASTPKQLTPTPKLVPASPKTPEIKKTPGKMTLVRMHSSTEKPRIKSPSTPNTRRREREPEVKAKPTSTEPIRQNVRKALQEHLTLRLAETEGVNFTDDQIKKFAVDTELEMHNLFKEVSMKYKAKYRSLIFNIKDRKNLSLWQKICDRSLTPKQLVRMSAEELASQELAQWRDKEAKYQLELIKKSELDLMAASKTYVLKTHKGEEVMEQKSAPSELDANVALEHLVTSLNDSTGGEEGASPDKDDKSKPSRTIEQGNKKSGHGDPATRSSSRHKNQKEEKSKGSHKKSKEDKERKVEERRSRRDRHKSRSRDRARPSKQRGKRDTRAKSASKDTSSSSDTKARSRSRERSKNRSRSRTRHRSRSKSNRSQSKYRSQSQERAHRSLSQENDYHSKDKYSSREADLMERPKSAMQKEVHPEYDPHEPMITSAFSEEDLRRSREASLDAIDLPESTPPEEYDPADTLSFAQLPPAASSSRLDRISSEAESDQEPSSTVDSAAPPVWSGLVNMVDVARFYVDAHQVSGNCGGLEEELSPELDIVGRINPETVWDYISKMKRTGNKDILVLRLTSSAVATVEERMQYIALYSYLSTRNRLGVVKVTNTFVKDFYVFPLAASKPLPAVLLPLAEPGLEEQRTHLLIAIIVRQKKKRHSTTKPASAPAKISKSSTRKRSYTPPAGGESYTPPTSPAPPAPRPNALRLPLPFVPPTPALSSSVKDKIAASLASAEEDEAYSPGGSSTGSSSGGRGQDSLRSRVDEINRQIEEQKKQILSIATATVQQEEAEEAYSPSRPMTPPRPALADIALPSNLQEILATIQQRSVAPPPPPLPPTDVDMRVPPPPPAGHLHALSEEELLRMVPDTSQ